MKKLLYTLLFLCFATLFFSCTKEIDKQVAVNQKSEREIDFSNIYSDERMLIFKYVDDYEVLVSDPSDELRAELIERIEAMEHTTYADYLSTLSAEELAEIDYDDYLSKILNSDGIVQIGENLYKVNTTTEKVYVMHEKFIEDYDQLLLENVECGLIQEFSTEDDVIDIIEGRTNEKCGEGGVGNRSSNSSHSDGTHSNGVKSKLRHSKYGIYFTMVVESYLDFNWPLSMFKFEFPTNSNERRFKRRCRDVQYVPYSGNSMWTSTTWVTSAKYLISDNVRNFSKYHVRAKCQYYQHDLSGSTVVLISSSGWMEIRVNF